MGIFDRKPNIEKLKEKKDVEGLIKALKHKDYLVGSEAAKALGEVGDVGAVEPLVQVLNVEAPFFYPVSCAAAEALAQIGDAGAVEPLIRALKDERLGVRYEAVKALCEIGDVRAVEPLIQALKDEWHIRALAAAALGRIGDKRAVDPLIQALKDKHIYVREGAASALGVIKDARAVEPLMKALEDKNRGVRKVAKEALEKLEAKEKRSSKLSSKRKATPQEGYTVSELVDEGASLGTRGEHGAALRCFNKALELNPRHASAWFNKGASLERLDKYEEALWCFNKALEIDPGLQRPPLRWRCPKCGCILEDDEFSRGWAAYSGTVTCSVCGKQYPAGDVHGGKYDIKPRKPKD